jgi:hypothetical protein
MTNASTGHALNDRNKGWRKAIRFALTENPVSDQAMLKRREEFQRRVIRKERPVQARR